MALTLTPATGSLSADIPTQNRASPISAPPGVEVGLPISLFNPLRLGWHFKRADIQVAEGMMFPTGRYNPGASNNVGTGYFGNHLYVRRNLYITKNKGTSANLFTDWEVHGVRGGHERHQKTPGQAFTMEWGLGQFCRRRRISANSSSLVLSATTNGK